MRMHRYTHICTHTKTTLSLWLTAGVSVWLMKLYPYNHTLSPRCKYGVLNDTVVCCIHLIPLFTSYQHWKPEFSSHETLQLPSFFTPSCAVCHHSQHKLVKPRCRELSPEHCSTNWHKCKHKIWARKHTHIPAGCWQMSFYFWLYFLSAGSSDTYYPCASAPAHAHTYI